MSIRRAIVIGNCQAPLLANALTVLSKSTIFDSWGVHLVNGADRKKILSEFVKSAKEKYDLILVIPLSDGFEELSYKRVRTTFYDTPVLLISNIYFKGLHPDLTYLGVRGNRILSPLNDYHSKLVLWGFVKGLTAKATERLFTYQTYDRVGYLAAWQESLMESKRRDEGLDVKITDVWLPIIKSEISFYTVNHPSPALVAQFAGEIASKLRSLSLIERSELRADPHLMDASLFSGSIFPVYPEIARHHGVPSIGGYVFKPPGTRINPLNLGGFVEESFELYSRRTPEEIRGAPAMIEIATTFQHLLTI